MPRLRRRIGRAFLSAPLATSWLLSRYVAHRLSLPNGLERRGLDEMLGDLDDAPPSRFAGAVSVAELSDVFALGEVIVSRAPRAVRPPTTCLHRSIARYALGRELDLRPHLVIALRADAASTEDDAIGHAWVEIDGRPTPSERLPTLVESYRHGYTPPAGHAAHASTR